MSKDQQPLPAEGTAEKFERQSQAVQQFAEWNDIDFYPVEPIRFMGEWLVQGCVSTLFAPSGVGKSFAVADAARSIALGEHPFGGAPLLQNECAGTKQRGLLITTEMTMDELKIRHGLEWFKPLKARDANGKYLKWNYLEIYPKYEPKSLKEQLPDLLTDIEEHLIQAQLEKRPFRFVKIDNCTTAYPDLLSSNGDAALLMRRIGWLASTYDVAVMNVMHLNKKGQGMAEYSTIDSDAIKGNKMIHIVSQVMIGFNECKGSDDRFYAIQTKARGAKKSKLYKASNCAVFEFVDYTYGDKQHARVEFVCTSTEEAERQQSKKEMMSDAQMRCFQIWDEDTARTGSISEIGFAGICERLESKYKDAAGDSPLKKSTVTVWKQKWREQYEAGERPNANAF